MNKKNFLLPALAFGMAFNFLLAGCNEKKQKDNSGDKTNIQTLVIDSVVYAQPGSTAPSCKLTLRLAYLENNDTVNQTIQRELFGPKYEHMTPSAFADSLVAQYVSEYRTDISQLLEEDLKNGMDPQDVPAWYNYEYELTSTIDLGMGDSIWNYSLTDYRYTGGAHPNTMTSLLNISGITGAILTKDLVFSPEAIEGLAPLIVRELAKQANELMETDTITSIDGLREAGILLDAEPYIPENFLLGADTLTLQYNRYEIAPYSMGDFTVKLPMSEVKNYLNIAQ